LNERWMYGAGWLLCTLAVFLVFELFRRKARANFGNGIDSIAANPSSIPSSTTTTISKMLNP